MTRNRLFWHENNMDRWLFRMWNEARNRTHAIAHGEMWVVSFCGADVGEEGKARFRHWCELKERIEKWANDTN